MEWDLQDRKLILHHPGMDVFWEVPADYEMPSPELRNLAEYLLLKGMGVKVPIVRGRRVQGSRVGLAYSGGVDSTAAFKLLPQPIPVYTEVVAPGKLHKLENAFLALAEVSGRSIKTNSDQLAKLYDKPRGFYGTGGFTVPLVLFADYLQLGVVADGNVLETAYLYSKYGHGTKYQPRNYEPIFERFQLAGLQYCMPCAGLTEVSTTKLAEGFRYAMGCMRGVGGQPCNNCTKCYRKRALQGNPIPPCKESESKVTREIVPMLPSLLWAVREKGLRHPLLNNVRKDIDWVDKWYADSLRFVPESVRPYLLRQLEENGIGSLTNDSAIRAWISDRNA